MLLASLLHGTLLLSAVAAQCPRSCRNAQCGPPTCGSHCCEYWRHKGPSDDETPFLRRHTRLLRKYNITEVSLQNSDDEVRAWAEARMQRFLPMRPISAPASCRKSGPRANDWLICELTPPCVVFSIGIGGEWTFDVAAAKAGCEVHSFDPTLELLGRHRREAARLQAEEGLHNLHFHELGMGTSTEYSGVYSSAGVPGLKAVAPLAELLRRYAGGRQVDILKIDCEGCEWREFAAPETAAALCTVRQLYIELHFSTTMGLADAKQALQLVSSFHDVVHARHRFAPFRVKMVPGDDSDQDKVLELLRQQAIDPVACCYIFQMQRGAGRC
ncbi:hypothetical protein EMIHUDRAFT_221969 [Emiliania huxleyi CCMP1516]|uniref:Methyltransferase domain-containing protein n=2 Tax=Emiliania huxleyi TaxID=2903 RepID=A0A0D3HXQ4_EMIH1|nr:hypothetical protein EMIHUDRAFT_221969 [Emiliania huxleyi CCMP1516]EOD03789.1 hypothetical protein EMIHUDRAFT_221969 [Emiliania huxleyi CCMP1516]|eukprot:XP_005756218.1 hypothetical protein EMIHUDRAFT_221969 [Emiliania huxleyi CCMP1516]